jgi:hypothetical protein
MPKTRYTVLDARWFSNASSASLMYIDSGCIGVVAIESFPGQWKAYIGLGYGISRESDEQRIAGVGSKLLPEMAHGFFPGLDIKKYGV